MHFGMTGTQRGVTSKQLSAAVRELSVMQQAGFEWMHNGDCIGADKQIGLLWQVHHEGLLWGHPPDIDSKRAYLRFDRCENAHPYLKRNRRIVDASRVLLVFPGEMKEIDRSGTWATYRYAKRVDINRTIIYPDGSIVRETST